MDLQMTKDLPTHAARSGRRELSRNITAWLFLLPIIVISIVVIYLPSFKSVYYSFTEWKGVGAATFVGLDNYQAMFADPIYWKALRNNLVWTAVFLTVPILMGLFGAAILAPIKRGQMFFRLLYFLPYTFASMINAHIWKQILHPRYGVGEWLATNGLPWAGVNLWGNEKVVLFTIMFVDNWRWWGFLVVVFLAAMQAVDTELYEAARLEGANRWQEFVHVTLPGIRSTFAFMVLITIMWSFLAFDYAWILTGGGPNHASEMLSTLVYKQSLVGMNAGYGSAIAMSMVFICAMVVIGYNLLRQKGWEI